MGFWSRFFNWQRDRRSRPATGGSAKPATPVIDTILGYRFHNPRLLDKALTHRSYANSVTMCATYERLEFLGDSVLGVIVARHLFQKFPAYTEGDLTKAKAALVNLKTLSAVARREDLGRFVKLSPEEERAGGRRRPSILCDVFEAVIGAVFLDGGLEDAAEIVNRTVIIRFSGRESRLLSVNFKGDLLEYLQGEGRGLPHYEVVNERGPDHEKIFTVAVCTNGHEIGRGIGPNKKEAEQQAAREALQALGQVTVMVPVTEGKEIP